MRYYVIMNGVNSLTIQGLAIRELPPISKPLMRNIREEIDGRNGDIITELGYNAYDKELEIGLYGESYDINDIIAFFNGKGTITFSDEPDKYYYYQILNQIDYEKLLKFKTASVVFHCQPFKYKVDEVPLEEELEYVEGEGTNITLNNTSNAIFNEFDLKGNTSQEGTPTPTDPIEVETTTGREVVSICGKNILDLSGFITHTNYAGLNISYSNGKLLIDGTATGNIDIYLLTTGWNTKGQELSNIINSQISYLTLSSTKSGLIYYFQINGAYIQNTINRANPTDNITNMFVRIPNGTSFNNEEIGIQLERNSQPSTYEEYLNNDYEINLGKNLLKLNDIAETTRNGITYSCNDGVLTLNGTSTGGVLIDFENVTIPKGTYYFNSNVNNPDGSGSYARYITTSSGTNLKTNNGEIVLNTDTSLHFRFYLNANCVFNNAEVIGQLEKGNQGTSFSKYFTPIELCKIGNYQDYLYKENNTWYIHKEIEKVVLNGSENWEYSGGNNVFYTSSITDYALSNNIPYSNYYNGITNVNGAGGMVAPPNNTIAFINISGQTTPRFYVKDTRYTTNTNDLKTWLSTNPLQVYYALNTPTNEAITNEELINQLDALMLATAQEGQTNIIQSTFYLPFLIKVSALKQNSDHLIINNIGNTFAKPTLDLEGTGIVDIYLNDVQVFQVDLSEVNEIVLNTAEMEAYNPNTHQLANRQVTGDYSNFKLDVGENDLRFSGNLTKATVTYYQRWL